MSWSCIGHTEQKNQLERLIAGGRVPHAILFAGPEGVGKCMIARDLAMQLIGDAMPLDGNPDFMMVAPGINEDTGKPMDISVEVVREQMRPWAYTKPLYGARKVAIIDDAERLGGEAANTLLKVLEEPPTYLVFLLISSQPQAVLQTITSRCQLLRFGVLSGDEMSLVLANGKQKTSNHKLLHILSAGRPGAALRLLEGSRLKDATQSLKNLANALSGSVTHRIGLAKTVADADDPAEIAGWWLSYVHARLPEKPSLAPVAHGLLHLCTVLGESRYNRRLALEEFLLTTTGLK